jgi:hypothetical protein
VAVLERDGLPKIDPLMGGRFWPPVQQFFLDRHGVAAQPSHGGCCPQKAACASFHLRLTGSLISMVRKRKPLVVGGEIVQLDAPGLHVFDRRGRVEFYWKANPTARKHGYIPRTVRLHYDLSTIAGRLELEHRCRVLTAEMFAWLGDPEGDKKLVYDGTVGALIRCYQTDESSPYRGLRQSTSRVYGDWCRTLDRAIGRRRVDHLTGRDVRDCLLRLMEPTTPGEGVRSREMLSILLRYGAEVGLPGCLELLTKCWNACCSPSRKTFAVPGKPPGRKSLACATSTPQRSWPKGLSEVPASPLSDAKRDTTNVYSIQATAITILCVPE